MNDMSTNNVIIEKSRLVNIIINKLNFEQLRIHVDALELSQ